MTLVTQRAGGVGRTVREGRAGGRQHGHTDTAATSTTGTVVSEAWPRRRTILAERSQELLELATGESSDARGERDAALADLAGAEQTIKDLQRRVRELQGQNKRLEEKVDKAAPGTRQTMGDGTWRVGEEVVPGTYRAPGGGNCYWERLSNFSGDLGGIIANGFADRNPTVTIASSDAGFSTDGCGTWTKIG